MRLSVWPHNFWNFSLVASHHLRESRPVQRLRLSIWGPVFRQRLWRECSAWRTMAAFGRLIPKMWWASKFRNGISNQAMRPWGEEIKVMLNYRLVLNNLVKSITKREFLRGSEVFSFVLLFSLNSLACLAGGLVAGGRHGSPRHRAGGRLFPGGGWETTQCQGGATERWARLAEKSGRVAAAKEQWGEFGECKQFLRFEDFED